MNPWRLARGARAASDRVRPWRLFDRPVFVLAVPRSGSTLLYDLLTSHPGLWGWDGESTPAWWRLVPDGHTQLLGDTWPRSYGTTGRRRAAERVLFRDGVRSRGGARTVHDRLAHRRIRYVDKAPANSVRGAALAAMWPEARFVHLHRDGPANVASLLESWTSPLGVRDPVLPGGRVVEWRMLLPEGWVEYADDPPVGRCAFQWHAGNRAIRAALAELDPARVCEVRYDDLVADPEAVARRLCDLAELPWHPAVASFCRRMPASKVVLSAPRREKWRERESELRTAAAALAPMSEELGYSLPW